MTDKSVQQRDESGRYLGGFWMRLMSKV